MKEYFGENTNYIRYPIGGIGTGNFLLTGNGYFMGPDFNAKPNNDSFMKNTSFAIKAERGGKVLDWRMLMGDVYENAHYNFNGTGCNPPLCGFNHFSNTKFSANFPFINIDFCDGNFPGKVKLSCFNPFIPCNEKDSSIPTGIFKISISNPTDKCISYTVAFNLSDVLGRKTRHYFERKNNLSYFITSTKEKDRSRHFTDIVIMTDAQKSACQKYWLRGGLYFDIKTMFMNDFSTFGDIAERDYADMDDKDTGTLTATIEVKPNETKDINFYLCWFTSNFTPYWLEKKEYFRYSYAKYFKGAKQIANYVYKNRNRLYKDTLSFSNGILSSSMPSEIIDAINRNLCVLKSSTMIRLYDGSLWGWEGVYKDSGSCEGTCQHVYNYQYTLPFLFPNIERGILDNYINYALEENGLLHFRMPITRREFWSDRPAVDGQMGTIVNFYREFLLSGDLAWLKGNWQKIKLMMEFAWSDKNVFKWDSNKSGIITGMQHNTLDIEIFGANAWLTGYYHLALVSASKMAKAVGDERASKEYMSIFVRGRELLDKLTFNGEYYEQNIDLKDKDSIKDFYKYEQTGKFWDEDKKEIKYQIFKGCEIDQVLASWHGDILDIKDLFIYEHRLKALNSIYTYNFKCMRDHNNPCRVFALNGESGTIMTSFPHGKQSIPILYSEECMSGFEYAFAQNLLLVNEEEKALKVVNAVCDRYDGKRRNPFAEMECGFFYTRAMACYGFLLIYSGFKFDLSKNRIGFMERRKGQYFWSVNGAWGVVKLCDKKIKLKVLYGKLKLDSFITKLDSVGEVICKNKKVGFSFGDNIVTFNKQIILTKNSTIKINS